uniref:Uncharacterized protein n=1 Tax=Schistocephalus solidus TaxID=70667 RepID=A0A0X3PAF6_SCHSO
MIQVTRVTVTSCENFDLFKLDFVAGFRRMSHNLGVSVIPPHCCSILGYLQLLIATTFRFHILCCDFAWAKLLSPRGGCRRPAAPVTQAKLPSNRRVKNGQWWFNRGH